MTNAADCSIIPECLPLRKGTSCGIECVLEEEGRVVGGGAPLVIGLAGDGLEDLMGNGDGDANWFALGNCDALSDRLHDS